MNAENLTNSLDRMRFVEQLTAFAPKFRNPATVFGKWRPSAGTGTWQDPLIGPWFEMSEVAHEFLRVVNRFIGNLEGFDWQKWIKEREGRDLYQSVGAIGTANGEQLAKLSLALVRADRFCEGVLARAYEDKILLAIAERAEVLVKAARLAGYHADDLANVHVTDDLGGIRHDQLLAVMEGIIIGAPADGSSEISNHHCTL